MVDRTKMTDKECIDSLADCIRIVDETKAQLRLYESVLESSQQEFMRRFSPNKDAPMSEDKK